MVLSDIEIIEKIRSGEIRQYSSIVEKYKDKAFSLAFGMLKNREDAEEAAEDAFIRAYNALERFEKKASFGTWFYRIVYNTCLTRIESKKNDRKSFEFDEKSRYAEDIAFSGPSLFENIEARDMIAFIKKIMKEIPDKYQVILSLFYFQELNYQEIAEVLGLPIGTIKTNLFRARAILQKKMQGELRMDNAS